jgi:hypothetical protein
LLRGLSKWSRTVSEYPSMSHLYPNDLSVVVFKPRQ